MFNPDHPYDLPQLPLAFEVDSFKDKNKLTEAHRDAMESLQGLNEILNELDDPEIFLSGFYLKESISSSEVEHIYTTIESVLDDQVSLENERKEQNKEVLNYRAAILEGLSSYGKYSLSSRTILAIHEALQVQNGTPGQYRKVQNKIGHRERGRNKIIYTPPEISKLAELMSNWEQYVHNENEFAELPLVKLLVCHYQFEAIHPFEDGNGRVGRILMVLQLVHEKLLKYPALFISAFLSREEIRYKEWLMKVTEKGEWENYLTGMMLGIAIQAMQTQLSIRQLQTAMYRTMVKLAQKDKLGIRLKILNDVVKHIFYYPITHSTFMAEKTGIHWQTCGKYLKILEREKILESKKSGRYLKFENKLAIEALHA